MAKSKKNQKKDFQKVKLKVGKKLKKADNVTNTSFRTKAIQISQQLKKGDDSQPSTKKKQNIKDLFSQCRHYNASVRLESLNGLRELINANPELVSSHLSELLEKTAELLTDKDSVVRKGSIRMFKLFLPLVSEKQISPFFPLLCAHLCCAMTHIFDDIQVDSLSVFDLLLDNYPKLMVFKSNEVLSNFIEQISRQQGQGQTKRSISTNPNSATSSIKWRTSVLNRLQKLLSAILEFQNKTGKLPNKDQVELDGSVMSTEHEVNFDPEDVVSVQLFPAYTRHQWETAGFILGGDLSKQSSGSEDRLSSKFPEFADTLLPLMLECWVESAPSKTDKSSAGGNLIQGENVFMMYSVLQVTRALWECIHVLSNEEGSGALSSGKYLKDFEQHFMANFPYSVNSRISKKDKKQNPDSMQVSADMLNLSVCDIMTSFVVGQTANQSLSHDSHWLPMITQYLCDFLSGKYGGASVGQNARTIVKILSRLSHRGYIDDWVTSTINAVHDRFEMANIASTEKRVYLEYLSDIIFSDRFICPRPELRTRFLQSLPELLPLCARDSPQMASLIIKTMKMAACQRCDDFINQKLFQFCSEWFDSESGIIASLPVTDQRRLIDLLYSVRHIDLNLAMTLCNLSQSNVLATQQVCYMIQVLQNRYLQSAQAPEEVAVYIGYLTSLLMGMSITDYEKTLKEHHMMEAAVLGGYRLCCREWLDTVKPDDIDRCNAILESISSVTKQFMNTEQVLQLMFRCLEKTLQKQNLVPLPVIFQICRFAESLLCVPEEFIPLVNDLGLSLVSHLVMWDLSANQSAWNCLLNLGCDLLLRSVKGPQSVFVAAISCLNKQGCSSMLLVLTLKVVIMFLSERSQQLIKGDNCCMEALSNLKDILKSHAELHMDSMTAEAEKLLSQFTYLVSRVL